MIRRGLLIAEQLAEESDRKRQDATELSALEVMFRRLVNDAMRGDPKAMKLLTLSPGQTYIRTWHVDAIASRLVRVRRGKSRRLIINMPPRSLKSIAASVAFPAFLLERDPTRRIICVAASAWRRRLAAH
jgi:hypothetical protein